MRNLKDIIAEKLKVNKTGIDIFQCAEAEWKYDVFTNMLDDIAWSKSTFFEKVFKGQDTVTEYAFTIFDDDDKFKSIKFEEVDGLTEIDYDLDHLESSFGSLEHGDHVNMFVYKKNNDNALVIEMHIDGIYYYSVFAKDKAIVQEFMSCFPDDIDEDPDDIRPLIQAYELMED